MGTSPMDLDDVTQEVFLVAHRKLGQFEISSPGPWLYRVVERTVSAHRRLAWVRRVVPRSDTRLLADVVDDEPSPAEALEAKERERQLAQLLARLNPHQQAAFMLFEVGGFRAGEIARLQQVSVKTVRSRLRLAREKVAALRQRARRLCETPDLGAAGT